MTDTQTDKTAARLAHRKPRLALMGEFSAGKSTLSNLLLGCAPLPVRVTATRLPPVWISYGEEDARRVDMGGVEHPLNIEDLSDIQLEDTRLIKLYLKADALEICDLIDMPGISDPNMSSDVWQGVFSEVDSVVWCTHATQAWRQSEAAVWESIHAQTNGNNLLLISQFDKLRTERDQARVLGRVQKETDGLFKAVFPVSLLQALNAENDVELWKKSGAAQFTDALIEMLLSPAGTEYTPKTEYGVGGRADLTASVDTEYEAPQVDDMVGHKAKVAHAIDATHETAAPSPVRPRRIRASASSQARSRLPTGSVTGVEIKELALEASPGE